MGPRRWRSDASGDREVDLAVRWGGEEFVILGRGLDRAGIERLARRLLEVVAASRVEVKPGQRLSTTASAGFVYYPIGRDGRGSWRDVLEIADRLMYRAKRDGRARAYGLVWNELNPPDDPESLLMADLLADGIESSATHEIVLVTMSSNDEIL
jgi:predicted signal transduction protein with EAL and GGDEF domain